MGLHLWLITLMSLEQPWQVPGTWRSQSVPPPPARLFAQVAALRAASAGRSGG